MGLSQFHWTTEVEEGFGVYGGEEADLVIGFSSVRFAEALDVYVAGVASAFAGGDEGVFFGVFVVEAHVAYGGVFAIWD